MYAGKFIIEDPFENFTRSNILKDRKSLITRGGLPHISKKLFFQSIQW